MKLYGVTSSTLTVLNVALLCFRCASDLLDFFVLHSQTRVLIESGCLSLINHVVLISVKLSSFAFKFFANSFESLYSKRGP